MFTCLVLWEYWYLVLRVFISKSFLVHPSIWQLFFEVEVGSLPTATHAPIIAIPKLSQKSWIIHTNCIAIVANLFLYISIELAPILGFLKLPSIQWYMNQRYPISSLIMNFLLSMHFMKPLCTFDMYHILCHYIILVMSGLPISGSRVVKGIVPLTYKNCIPTDKGYQKVAVIYK